MRLLLIAALMVGSAVAGDLSGIWTGQLANKFGEIDDISFRFVQNGSVLTGKMYGDNESTPVKDGKVDGDRITFSITTELNGGPRTFLYSGTISGKQIQVERQRMLRAGEAPPTTPQKPQEFTLKPVL